MADADPALTFDKGHEEGHEGHEEGVEEGQNPHEEGKCIYHNCACGDCQWYNLVVQAVSAGMGMDADQFASTYKAQGVAKPVHSQAVHKFIQCDVCQRTPIIGPRLSCMVCPRFDMCLLCAMSNAHNADHLLVVTRVPQPVMCTCDDAK
jgi:hypothetical protein